MNPLPAVALALALVMPVQGQQAPAVSADRAALEARLLALMPLPPPIEARAHTSIDALVQQFDDTLIKRNPGKETIIHPILINFRTCTTDVIFTAIAQMIQKSLSDMSDDDLRHVTDFLTSQDGSEYLEIFKKLGNPDNNYKDKLGILIKKYPEQILILSKFLMRMKDIAPESVLRPEHGCFITAEKSLVQAGIDTGETPRYQREVRFVTVAGPDITARFVKGDLSAIGIKMLEPDDASPDRKGDTIAGRDGDCWQQASAALAARLLPQLAADLPDDMLDRMIAFYTSPDEARYARLVHLFDPTRAQQAELAALRKKYGLDAFNAHYMEIFFSAISPPNPDPEWAAASQSCDAAYDRALKALPKPMENKP